MNKLTFYFLFLVSLQTIAQKWEVGAGVGVCQYKGDIMPYYKPFVGRPGGNLFVRYNLSRAISIKANGLAGFLYGNDKLVNDPFHKSRERSFNSNFLEGGGQIEYNFLNFRTNASRIVKNWTPYVLLGVGGAAINSKSKFKTDINPSVFSTYAANKRERVWILGIGFKKKLNGHWNWGVEFGTRWVSSDFVDNFGFNQDGTFKLALPPGIDPGNPKYPYIIKYQIPDTKLKDMYYYTNVSLSYVFYKVYCPK